MSDRMPKPMAAADLDALRNYLSGDLHSEPPWDGCDGMESVLARVLAAHDFWRSVARRGPITVSTVIAFEVTPAKLDAWLRAQPEMTAEREDGSDEIDWHMRDLYVCTTGHGDRREAVRAINTMAAELNRDRWDILAEIAAMEVDHA